MIQLWYREICVRERERRCVCAGGLVLRRVVDGEESETAIFELADRLVNLLLA